HYIIDYALPFAFGKSMGSCRHEVIADMERIDNRTGCLQGGKRLIAILLCPFRASLSCCELTDSSVPSTQYQKIDCRTAQEGQIAPFWRMITTNGAEADRPRRPSWIDRTFYVSPHSLIFRYSVRSPMPSMAAASSRLPPVISRARWM